MRNLGTPLPKWFEIPGVYIAYEGDEIIYVGMSKHVVPRIFEGPAPKGHGNRPKNIYVDHDIEIILLEDIHQAEFVEKGLLVQYRPKFNSMIPCEHWTELTFRKRNGDNTCIDCLNQKAREKRKQESPEERKARRKRHREYTRRWREKR
jgi:hypothetical protein